jgi:hypothetical protein
MKSVVANARQSVHFNDDLDRYLSNTTVKSEAMDENDIDYHTPMLKRKDGLSSADKMYGMHTRCHTNTAVQLKTMIHMSYFVRALHIAHLISACRVGNRHK